MKKLFLILDEVAIKCFEIEDTSTENINDIVKDDEYVLESILEDENAIFAIVSK